MRGALTDDGSTRAQRQKERRRAERRARRNANKEHRRALRDWNRYAVTPTAACRNRAFFALNHAALYRDPDTKTYRRFLIEGARLFRLAGLAYPQIP